MDAIKESAVKEVISKELDFRITNDSYKLLATAINKLIEETLKIAIEEAKQADRKTIMGSDVKTAMDKAIAKSDLNWEEIFHQIMKETPADLGKITGGIEKYLESQ